MTWNLVLCPFTGTLFVSNPFACVLRHRAWVIEPLSSGIGHVAQVMWQVTLDMGQLALALPYRQCIGVPEPITSARWRVLGGTHWPVGGTHLTLLAHTKNTIVLYIRHLQKCVSCVSRVPRSSQLLYIHVLISLFFIVLFHSEKEKRWHTWHTFVNRLLCLVFMSLLGGTHCGTHCGTHSS